MANSHSRRLAAYQRQLTQIRQQSADARATEQVIGTPERPGETDGPGFWSTVGQMAQEAWQEMGTALKWGTASAVDEYAATARAKPTAEAAIGGRIPGAAEALAEDFGVTPYQELEVNLRETMELKQPDTAGGNALAAITNVSVGAGLAGATMKGWMGPKGVGKVAETTLGKLGKAVGEATTSKTAVAFAVSDFAAFPADEKRMLVVMNEIPAFADWVPDALAADDPNDPELIQRLERALEGHLIGTALELGVRAGVHYVKAVKAGQAAKGIDAPDKDKVGEILERQAVEGMEHTARRINTPQSRQWAEQQLEGQAFNERRLQELQAERAGLEQQAATPAGQANPIAIERRLEGIAKEEAELAEGAAMDRPPVLADEQPVSSMGDVVGYFLATESRDRFRDNVVKALSAEKKGALRAWQQPEKLRFTTEGAEAVARSAAEAAGEAVPEEAGALARFLDPAFHDEHLSLATVSSREAGIDRFGTDADSMRFLTTERTAWSRLREWQADPENPARRQAAFIAEGAFYREYAAQGGRGEVGALPVLEGPERTAKGFTERVLDETKDLGRRSPQLDAARARATGALVTERMEPVSVVRAGQPADFGQASGDVHLARQRPEEMEGIVLEPEYRGGLDYDAAKAVDQPIDVWPENVRVVEDYGRMLEAVGKMTRGTQIEDAKSAAKELEEAIAEPKAALEKAVKAQEAAEGKLATFLKDAENPSLSPKQRASFEERFIPRERKLVEKAQATRAKAQERVRSATQDLARARQERWRVVEHDSAQELAARVAANTLLREFYFPGFKLAADIDGREALRLVESMSGTVQRLAVGAFDNGADAASAALFARAMQKYEGMVAYLAGDVGRAKDALRRGAAEVEPDELVEGTVRRWRDHRLIAQSGGIQALRETAALVGRARSTREALSGLKRWKQQTRFAWSLGERMGLHNAVPSGLRVMFGNYLSGPVTHGVNIASGLGMTTLRVGEDAMSGAFFGEFAGTAAETTPKAAAARRAAATVRAAIPGLWDGFRMGVLHFGLEATPNATVRGWVGRQIEKQGLDHLYAAANRRDHFEESVRHLRLGAPEFLKDLAQNEGQRAWIEGLGDALGFTVGGGWVTTLMQSGDLLVKGINNRMQLQHDAVTQALKEGLRGDAYATRVDELLREPTEEMGRRATVAGQLATFTEDPGKWTAALQAYAHRYPSIRLLLMPFIRTPGNALRQGMEMTPGLARFVDETDRMGAAKGSPEAKARRRARQAMGSMLIVGAGWMAFEGRLSGSPVGNEKLAASKRKLGIPDDAVQLGDGTWIKFNQLGGKAALPISIMANLYELQQAADRSEEISIAGQVSGLAASVLGFAIDESGIQGLVELGEIMTSKDPDRIANGLAKLGMEKLAAAGVPGHGSLGRSLERQRLEGVTADHRMMGGAGGEDETFKEQLMEDMLQVVNETKNRIWWLGQDSNQRPRYALDGEPLRTAMPAGVDSRPRIGIFMSSWSQNKMMEEDQRPQAVAIRESGWVVPRLKWSYMVQEPGMGKARQSEVLEYTPAQYDLFQRTHYKTFWAEVGKRIKGAYWGNNLRALKDGRIGSHRSALHAELNEAWNKGLLAAHAKVKADPRFSADMLDAQRQAVGRMVTKRAEARRRLQGG